MAVEQSAKNTELKYYENLSKSLALYTEEEKRKEKTIGDDQSAVQRQLKRDTLDAIEKNEAEAAQRTYEKTVERTDKYRSNSRDMTSPPDARPGSGSSLKQT